MSTNVTQQEKLPRVAPAADVVELEDGFHIYLDMPGVQREDLVIDVDKDELTISGRSALPADPESADAEGGRSYVHVEFGGAEFRRTFTLSDSVDRERITAHLQDGVLDLVMPKSEAAKPRKIEISVN